MILCAAANPSIDKLFVVESIELGAIHRPLEFLQLPGGKGVNVARAVRALGGPARVATLLGGHAGRWLAEELDREGIEAAIAWSSGETRSSLSVADRSRGRLTEFYEAPAPIDALAWAGFLQTLEASVPTSRWLAISGSLPAGAPLAGYGEVISVAHRGGARVALDTSGRGFAPALAQGPDAVKVNADEASELLGEPVTDAAGALEAAAALRERAGGDGHLAIVTLGGAGAVMVGPDGSRWSGRPPARGLYPVGSGDAFLGGLLLGLSDGETPQAALARALAAGTANAEIRGAGRLNPQRARSLVPLTAVQASLKTRAPAA